jgi:hypothetical protein
MSANKSKCEKCGKILYNYEEHECKLDQNYQSLYDVLMDAYKRASVEKGKERHGDGKPFEEQYIMRGARREGIGGLRFQVGKKFEEAQKMEPERAIKEYLDAIVYLSACVILLRESQCS